MASINFPETTTSLLVNTWTTSKIVYLPAVSTVGAGKFFYIKDICGNAAKSTIYISTIGLDQIDQSFPASTINGFISTNFASVLLAPDGRTNWMVLQNYIMNGIIRDIKFPPFLPGLWAKFYSLTGQPDSNGPPGNPSGTSGAGWVTALVGTFTSGPVGTLGSNTPGPTNIIYYGNDDGYRPVSTYNYGGIYSGFIYSATSGTIQFQVQTDDGFLLNYNGVNAIISWQGQGPTIYTSASLTMPAGYTRILMRWYDSGVGGQSRMWYNINNTGYSSNGTGVYFYAQSNITQL